MKYLKHTLSITIIAFGLAMLMLLAVWLDSYECRADGGTYINFDGCYDIAGERMK